MCGIRWELPLAQGTLNFLHYSFLPNKVLRLIVIVLLGYAR